jgi:hypothetical protein
MVRVETMYAGHLDLSAELVWTVDHALPVADCDAYIAKMRASAGEIAPVVGREGPEIDLATRNDTRVMWDDEAEANALLARVGAQVPRRLSGRDLCGANPRLRLYRYESGQRHGAHWDSVVELAGGVRSALTLVFYLNDDFLGGATDFPELGRAISPKRGRALLFSASAPPRGDRGPRGREVRAPERRPLPVTDERASPRVDPPRAPGGRRPRGLRALRGDRRRA